MKIAATFVRSAASARDFPQASLPEVAFVGRSNVGKSSLINALTRLRLARTSAAPGKTRLANIYRAARGTAGPVLFVDLPGYGYARGGTTAAREFEALTRAYFDPGGVRLEPDLRRNVSALLLVDARHAGLESDVAAWRWLRDAVEEAAIVATKVDKLARGQRIRALKELESVFEDSVLPVSAVTGEGLDELWKLIDRLANRRNRKQHSSNRNSSSRPGREAAEGTAPRQPRK